MVENRVHTMRYIILFTATIILIVTGCSDISSTSSTHSIYEPEPKRYYEEVPRKIVAITPTRGLTIEYDNILQMRHDLTVRVSILTKGFPDIYNHIT